MELTGEHRIPAPRQKVWEALHDPEILKACITGCQRLEKVDDKHLSATVLAKVGPVKATFDAKVEIQNEIPPEHYTLVGEGKGGVAGFAKGSADVDLREEGDETVLTYRADAHIGGKLAQIGSRLVETTAKRYAADFFESFSRIVGGAAPVAADVEATAPELADVTATPPSETVASPATDPMPAPPRGAEPAAPTPSGPTTPPVSAAPLATPSVAPRSATPSSPATPAPKPGWIGVAIWGGLAVVAVVVAIAALT